MDADNPADGIDQPYNPGKTTSITIDRATVDAVFSGANGVISSYTQYATLQNYALTQAGAGGGRGESDDLRRLSAQSDYSAIDERLITITAD